MTAAQRGARGEKLAARHYKKRGYTILATNYRTRMGEVDIVAAQDGVLVFAEVKTRGENSIAAPREFVDARKQHRIIQAAREYMANQPGEEPVVRFDVVEVVFTGAKPALHCIENAFGL